MGAGFLQDLANTNATQNATNNNIYTTTPGTNFNYTTQNAPYWGKYTVPLNINPPQTEQPVTVLNNKNKVPSGQVYYDANKGQYYTQSPGIVGWTNAGERNYMGAYLPESKSSSSSNSFNNPSPLPNYSMYIPPSQMPDVNAYLSSPDSVLSSLRTAGVPIAGAGRYSNSLLNSSKGK